MRRHITLGKTEDTSDHCFIMRKTGNVKNKVSSILALRAKTEEPKYSQQKNACVDDMGKKVHCELTRRILTAGGKRKFPKDFFAPDSPLVTIETIDSERTPRKPRKIPSLDLKIKLNQQNFAKIQRDTPKFSRTPFDFTQAPVYNEFLSEEDNIKNAKQAHRENPLSRREIVILKKIQHCHIIKEKHEKILNIPQNTKRFFPNLPQ